MTGNAKLISAWLMVATVLRQFAKVPADKTIRSPINWHTTGGVGAEGKPSQTLTKLFNALLCAVHVSPVTAATYAVPLNM